MESWDDPVDGEERPCNPEPKKPIKSARGIAALDELSREGVVVQANQVVAAADTSHELAYTLNKLGSIAERAVIRYVAEPSDSVMVGLG